jgi:tetratricopeptide (TPR) repeat protein
VRAARQKLSSRTAAGEGPYGIAKSAGVYAGSNPMMRVIVLKSLLVLLFIALLCSRVYVVTGMLMNNLGALILVKELQSQVATVPHCSRVVDRLESRSYFEYSLHLWKENARAWFNLGRSAWLEGDCERALTIWHYSAGLAPYDVINQWAIANAFYAIGDQTRALTLYRSFDITEYFTGLGQQIEKRGTPEEAIEAYELSIAIKPTRKAIQGVSGLYVRMGEPEKAIAAWRKLLTVTSETQADHWWARGQIAELEKNWERALSDYQRAISLEKDRYFLYLLYTQAGVASREQKEYAAARRYFESAAEINPSMWAYLHLGFFEQQQKRYDEALRWYQRADEMDPQSEWPEYYQGILFWETGEKDRAKEFFVQAEIQNPRNAFVSFYLGLAAYEAKDLAKAIDYLEQAIGLYQGRPAYWARLLGDWQAQAGRCTEALATYRQIIRWQPGNTDIQQRLQRVQQECK